MTTRARVGLTLVMLLALMGFGGFADAAQRKLTVVVLMPNAGDPYFQNKSYGYIQGKYLAELKYPGIEVQVEMYDAGGYENVERQLAQLENAIQRRVDAIVITATNAVGVSSAVEEAVARGIPVISDDVLVATDKVTMKISENSRNVGAALAQFIAERLNGKGNVVMLKGPAGGILFMERAAGAKEVFSKYPGIRIIAEQWHPSSIVAATQVMENFLQAHGKAIDAVWSGNSTQAAAAGRVLLDAGWQRAKVLTVGADLHDEAIRALNEGTLTGVLPAQPVKLARLALTYAVDAAMGQQVPSRVYTTDEFVLTRETLKTFDTSDSMAPPGWRPPLR